MCRMSWYEGQANCDQCCHWPCFCEEEEEELLRITEDEESDQTETSSEE